MENASKALLIAGAILLCILIIAIGMFIYNSAQGTIIDSLNSLSTQQIESFNNQFMTYQGVQKGTNVKMLLGKLIANANTYADERAKIPGIYYTLNIEGGKILCGNLGSPKGGITRTYIDGCGNIRKKIKINHEYYVAMNYQENGLIDYIFIHSENKDYSLHNTVHRSK